MIQERTTISIECDQPNCGSGATICEPDRDAANRRLFELGWRLYHNKQVCPRHAEAKARQLAIRGK